MTTSLIEISRQLSSEVRDMRFGGEVAYVYNPLDYAWAPHALYLRRYGHFSPDDGPLKAPPKGRLLMIGMNPGPFGMAQVGVPFGEIHAVRDWMGLEAPVERPSPEHVKRPITGFETERSEVSGARLWGWAKDRFGTPDAFFSRFWVHNTVPLVFMAETGRNITPDKLPIEERTPLLDVSDQAVRKIIDLLEPSHIVAVGVFAEQRAKAASKGLDVPVVRILHPSPASPKANAGWAPQAEAELAAAGIRIEDLREDLLP